jgi:hypothetical protein
MSWLNWSGSSARVGVDANGRGLFLWHAEFFTQTADGGDEFL